MQNNLAPDNLSNLSFLVGAEELIYRTPPGCFYWRYVLR